jgi:hypothetical protein
MSGADDRGRRWIEMPPGVHNRLGTKAAHTENEDDVLEGFHGVGLGLGWANVAVMVAARRPEHHREV